MEKFEFRSSIYFWLHTSFSAVSIAFFLSLLSANPDTIDTWSIKFASVLFCISVILNSGLSMFLAYFGKIEIYVNPIYYTLYPWNELRSLPAIAIYSFILGIIFLFGYYSWFYAFTGVIAILYTGLHLQSKVNQANNGLFDKIEKSN